MLFLIRTGAASIAAYTVLTSSPLSATNIGA
jgi:hypothetical protein